jgi:hypothetical protein
MRDDEGSPALDAGQPRPSEKTGPSLRSVGEHAEARGWASLSAGGGDTGGALEVNEDGASERALAGSGGAGGAVGEAREPARGKGAARSSKRSLGALGDGNSFEGLRDVAGDRLGGEGEGGGKASVRADSSVLLAADDFGRGRRDAPGKGPVDQGLSRSMRDQAGTSKQELKALKPLISLSEWMKLSSAKQRKKMRKIAAREDKHERLRAVCFSDVPSACCPVSLRGHARPCLPLSILDQTCAVAAARV